MERRAKPTPWPRGAGGPPHTGPRRQATPPPTPAYLPLPRPRPSVHSCPALAGSEGGSPRGDAGASGNPAPSTFSSPWFPLLLPPQFPSHLPFALERHHRTRLREPMGDGPRLRSGKASGRRPGSAKCTLGDVVFRGGGDRLLITPLGDGRAAPPG